jgi:hypothetical protein
MFMRFVAPVLMMLLFIISLFAFVYVDARHWWPRRRKDRKDVKRKPPY